ncbi:50S ribosomal protein L19 [bacterium]|nr:50S ribosomal protein L19 [bacterium]
MTEEKNISTTGKSASGKKKEEKSDKKLESKKKKKGNQKLDFSLVDINTIKTGMVVRIHEKIKEKNTKGEEKERIQIFEGTVIAHKHGKEIGATITVRKISGKIGVEKIFPIHSPLIEKIELKTIIKARKAKLYYLKNYKKRLKKVAVK